jgi:hypothetical protein
MKFTLLMLRVMFMGRVYAAVDVSATNNLPNPYRPIENRTQLRFPLYFDGIVSGAPAFRVTHAAIGSAWETLAFLKIAPKTIRTARS